MDKILEKFGLKYSDLEPAERETLQSWLSDLESNALSVEKLRGYIAAMKDAVEQEVTQTTHNSKQDIFLKARLRNYILLDAFLSSPEKAKKAIELQLSSIRSKV